MSGLGMGKLRMSLEVRFMSHLNPFKKARLIGDGFYIAKSVFHSFLCNRKSTKLLSILRFLVLDLSRRFLLTP